MLNLFVNSLISQSYASVSSMPDLSSIPLQSPAQIIDRGERAGEGGIFSAFTSYVSSFANDEPPEPSDQEIEYTLCTVDCVSSCSFEIFFQNIRLALSLVIPWNEMLTRAAALCLLYP